MSRSQGIITREHITAIAVPIIALLLWELAVRIGLISPRFISTPLEIINKIIDMSISGELWIHVKASMQRIIIGFLLGVIPGIAIGALMGFSKSIRVILEPIVALIFPIPKIAILPLLLVFLGLGEASKIALIALGAIFLTLYNTMSGVRNLPVIYEEVAENFGATKMQYIFQVALPGAMPSIITGLRLSLQNSLLLIVAAEFVGAKEGIGYLIWSSWEIFDVNQMFAGLVTLCAIGYLLSIGTQAIEKRYADRTL